MKYLNNKQSHFSGTYRNLTAASAFYRPKSAITLSMPMMKNGDGANNSGSGSNGNFNLNFAGAGLAIVGC